MRAGHSAEGAGDPVRRAPPGRQEQPRWRDGVYSAGNVAVDAIFGLGVVVTTFKHELAKAGVIFCSISEALREHPDVVRKYLGSVVP